LLDVGDDLFGERGNRRHAGRRPDRVNSRAADTRTGQTLGARLDRSPPSAVADQPTAIKP
ncbi:MAG: hypothetical protein ACK559_08080, partial [bacterium]